MTTARARFPRTSYANRVAAVAEELYLWVPGLMEVGATYNAKLTSSRRAAAAADRAYAIQDIAGQLQDLAIRILALK